MGTYENRKKKKYTHMYICMYVYKGTEPYIRTNENKFCRDSAHSPGYADLALLAGGRNIHKPMKIAGSNINTLTETEAGNIKTLMKTVGVGVLWWATPICSYVNIRVEVKILENEGRSATFF
jgi:hypothetical protein